MIVGIIGAGLQGEACAQILSKDNEIDQIYLGDIDDLRLNICRNNIDSDKLRLEKIDVKEYCSVFNFLKKCDVCIDMVLPEYCPFIMKVALAVGINYINTAYDTPFWNNIVKGEELYLNKEYKEKGLTALLGCGDSPGLVNIVAKKYCDKMDDVDSIIIKGIYSNRDVDLLEPWNPGWSLKQAYIDYITEPYIFRNSRFVKMQPFDEREKFECNEYGEHNIALHSHEEMYSLPYTIKGLKNCEFKYEIDPYAACLYSFGFNLKKEVKLEKEKIKAVDFLFKVLKDIDMKKVTKNNISCNDEYYSYLEISGMYNGLKKKYKIVLNPLYSNRKKIMERFGTLKIDVALPCIVGLKCLKTAKKGVIFAEELNIDYFLKILNNYVKYEEKCINKGEEVFYG